MNKIKFVLTLLASLTLGACSSDDDSSNPDIDPRMSVDRNYTVTTVDKAPEWSVDWSYTQERPDWQEPATRLYENWSIMKLQIEDTLKPYASTDDLIAVFVGDECRGVTPPAFVIGSKDYDDIAFLLKVYGNEPSGQMMTISLRYYCSNLRQVFERVARVPYNMDTEMGIGWDLKPSFRLGSTKFPVVMQLDVVSVVSKASIVPDVADRVAVFVGDECRGMARPGEPLDVFGRIEGESVNLQYYQTATRQLYTFPGVAVTRQEQSPYVVFDPSNQ